MQFTLDADQLAFQEECRAFARDVMRPAAPHYDASDVAMWATTALMDLVGPEASLRDHPLEKWFRDAKIYQVFEGTAQIQRLVVARMQTAVHREARLGEQLDEVVSPA